MNRNQFQPLALAVLAAAIGCAPAAPGATAPAPAADARQQQLGAARPGATTPLSQADSAWVEATLASLSLRERIAQLIMPWVGGEFAAVGSPEFEQLRKWVEEDGVGGLILSIGLPHSYGAKLNRAQQLARVPLLVASDMENGTGMRLANIYSFPSLLPQGGGTVFPPVMALGATGSEELAHELGQVLGREARAVGVHLTFGPVLDVNSNPLNPIINTRSFGEDPDLVARLAGAYIRGAHSMGLMTTGKHFPGHGDTEVDSHIALPFVRADRSRLDSVDFPPFTAAIAQDLDAIMTAHIAVPAVAGDDAVPATLSPYFMTGVLRNEMAFGGLVFTDAMTMGGIVARYPGTEPLLLAIEAGADVLLMPRDVRESVAGVLAAVRSGRISESRIDLSVRRILTAKARAGLRAGRLVDLDSIDLIVNVPAHSAAARRVAERSITLARDERNAVPLDRAARRILSISYADASDPIAGRVFNQELRAAGFEVSAASVDARTTEAEYAALAARADSADAVLASTYISPRAGRGSVAAEGGFPGLVQQLSSAGRNVIAISFGSPYVLSFFPGVPAYLLAWGGAPVSQRAAASALTGASAIGGRLPISLPPYHAAGTGLDRPARASR